LFALVENDMRSKVIVIGAGMNGLKSAVDLAGKLCRQDRACRDNAEKSAPGSGT